MGEWVVVSKPILIISPKLESTRRKSSNFNLKSLAQSKFKFGTAQHLLVSFSFVESTSAFPNQTSNLNVALHTRWEIHQFSTCLTVRSTNRLLKTKFEYFSDGFFQI